MLVSSPTVIVVDCSTGFIPAMVLKFGTTCLICMHSKDLTILLVFVWGLFRVSSGSQHAEGYASG